MYRSYSYSNMPEPVKQTTARSSREATKPVTRTHSEQIVKHPVKADDSLNLKNDDLILIIIAAILIFNGCNDKLLIAVLVYLFISGYNE